MPRALPWFSMIALAGLWVLLTRAAPSSWVVGLPFIVLAAVSSRRQASHGDSPLSIAGALRFIPFFLRESVRGGVDVAQRVLGRRLRVQPGFTDYQIRLQRPCARLLFANSVSLLPGTLAADINDDQLSVHALDTGTDFENELAQVEQRVARIFGETL